jgi:6-pyruvoyltetrahydropterin/6-carboxytetrahydropterin synthase
MYEITTEASFSAAHYLRDYRGPCENVHGHNWLVRATVRCEQLDDIGIGIDFRDLRNHLREVLAVLDHRELNTAMPDNLNPSCENIARYIYRQMKARIDGGMCRIHKIDVFETPGNSTTYYE